MLNLIGSHKYNQNDNFYPPDCQNQCDDTLHIHIYWEMKYQCLLKFRICIYFGQAEKKKFPLVGDFYYKLWYIHIIYFLVT